MPSPRPTKADEEIARNAPGREREAPRNRDDVVRPFRARRENEPALASFETDAEAGNFGGRYAGQPLERDERGRPIDPARQAAGEATPGQRPGDPADVRIGPGDAGRQRKPRVLPEKLQGRRDSWGRVGAVIGAGLLVALLIALLF